MDSVIEKLNENMQVLYRKAVDADKALEQLKGQGKGRHTSIFPKEAGFSISSDRFAPYIAELSEDIAELEKLQEKGAQQTADEPEVNQPLSTVVKKMEALFVTLAQFKGILAE